MILLKAAHLLALQDILLRLERDAEEGLNLVVLPRFCLADHILAPPVGTLHAAERDIGGHVITQRTFRIRQADRPSSPAHAAEHEVFRAEVNTPVAPPDNKDLIHNLSRLRTRPCRRGEPPTRCLLRLRCPTQGQLSNYPYP